MRVITSSDGFWLDKVAEVSVVCRAEMSVVERRKCLVISAHFLVRRLDRQVDSRYSKHITSSEGQGDINKEKITRRTQTIRRLRLDVSRSVSRVIRRHGNWSWTWLGRAKNRSFRQSSITKQ